MLCVQDAVNLPEMEPLGACVVTNNAIRKIKLLFVLACRDPIT